MQKHKTEFNFPPIVEQLYDFCLWLLPKVSKFQKDQKYILGYRLQNSALDALEFVIKASFAKNNEKVEPITLCIHKLEYVVFLMRLSVAQKLINEKSHLFGVEQLIKVIKALHLWKKSLE